MWKQFNNNPVGRSVGDCVVRAASVALDITWEEAFAKLAVAAFNTIKMEMFGDGAPIDQPAQDRGYSASAGPTNQQPETYVDYDSGTEFSRAIDGRDAYSVWEVMDELLSVLQATNPRLFDGVMRKIEEI